MQLTPGEHLVDTETAVDRFGRLWLVIKCDGETWDRIGPFKSEDELNAAGVVTIAIAGLAGHVRRLSRYAREARRASSRL